jgi:hypothetical protein
MLSAQAAELRKVAGLKYWATGSDLGWQVRANMVEQLQQD